MNLLQRASLLLLLVAMAALQANAWNPAMGARRLLGRRLVDRREPTTTSKMEPRTLAFRTGSEEEEMTVAMTFPLAVQQTLVMPNKWDLPRHSPSELQQQQEKLLWDTELLMGRAAMIAALTLMVGELTTGHSIANQIVTVLCLP